MTTVDRELLFFLRHPDWMLYALYPWLALISTACLMILALEKCYIVVVGLRQRARDWWYRHQLAALHYRKASARWASKK